MAATDWSGSGAIRAGMLRHPRRVRRSVAPLDCSALRPPGAVVSVSGAMRGPTAPRHERWDSCRTGRSSRRGSVSSSRIRACSSRRSIHTSYLNENPGIDVGSNERLEFLGDAALGVVVAQQLYNEYPDVDEGKLTELRAHLVRRDTLARAAARFELGEYLQLGRGEDAAGGRRRPTNMARAYEALVGAIFLDGGIGDGALRSCKRSLRDELQALRKKGMPHDPKSRLQEVIQSRWQTTPSYKLLKTEGPDHARRFTVQVMVGGKPLGIGEGRSKQMAEKPSSPTASTSSTSSTSGLTLMATANPRRMYIPDQYVLTGASMKSSISANSTISSKRFTISRFVRPSMTALMKTFSRPEISAESRAQLDQRGSPALHAHLAARRLGDAGDQLEHRALAGSVPSDDAETSCPPAP